MDVGAIPFGLFSLLSQHLRARWPSRSELRLQRFDEPDTGLQNCRDAWKLETCFMATNPTDIGVRIRDLRLTELTLVSTSYSIPVAHAVDLSQFDYEERRNELLGDGKLLPVTRVDGHREPRNNMQYSTRYLFSHSEAFDELVSNYDEIRATLTFQLQGSREFSTSVIVGGPITHEERG